jgi:hypothetical protein
MPLPAWDLLLEESYSVGGALSNSASLTKQVVGYETMTVTLGRRGPHALSATIPWAPGGSSHGTTLTRFDAWRELQVNRGGVPFLAGFQAEAAVPGGENGGQIQLAGLGSAMALVQFHGQQPNDDTAVNPNPQVLVRTSAASASRADNVIRRVLDLCIRGPSYPGTSWFPSGSRTIAVGTYTPDRLIYAGMSQLEIIQLVCDSEGWEWRAGVDSSGTWTFEAGASVNANRTATVLLDSPGNCLITSYQPDATRMASRVAIAIRNQGPATTVYSAIGAGVATIPIGFGTQDRYFERSIIAINPGTGTAEVWQVDYQSGAGAIIIRGGTTVYAHAANEPLIYDPATPYIETWQTTGGDFIQRHHEIRRVIYNDQLRGHSARTALARTIVDASDSLLHNVSVVITDIEYAESLLTLGLHPGDTVSLTSQRLPFTATTMQVQEIRLSLQDGGLARMEMQLGDPADDALAVLERWYGAARASATRAI